MTNVATPDRNTVRIAREAEFVPKLAFAAVILLAAGLMLDSLAFFAGLAFPGFTKGVELFNRIHVLVRLGTVISFLLWLHARYSSLRLVGWTSANYTPGVAVGWFFVPLLNLYKPYLVVQEMWGATDPESNWTLGNSRVVLAWWVAFVGAPISFFALATPGMAGTAIPNNLELRFICVLNIVAAILAILVVARIDARWKSKLDAMNALAVVSSGAGAPASALPPVAAAAAVPKAEAAVPSNAPDPRQSPNDAPVPPAIALEPYASNEPPPLPEEEWAQPPVEELAFRAPAPPPRPAPVMTDTAAVEAIALRLHGTRKAAIAIAIAAACAAAALLGAAGFIVAGTRESNDTVRQLANIVALAYLGLSMFALIPCVQLARFAREAGRFVKARALKDLETALRLQSRFWRFAGASAIAIVVLELSAIVITAATSLLEKMP